MDAHFFVPLPKHNKAIYEQIKHLTTTLSTPWNKYECNNQDSDKSFRLVILAW